VRRAGGDAVLMRLRRSPRPRPADSGFTLIELVISVAILGLVMSAACGAMLVALRSDQATGQRLGASNDQQYAATWFAEDIASANTVTANTTAVCGAAVTAVLNLTSTDIDTTTSGVPATPPPSPEPTTRSVSYVTVSQNTADGTFSVLERRACGTSGTTKVDRIAKRLSTTVAPVVDTAALPTVSLRLTAGDDGQTFTLYGTRRSS
jgi:prepilin-type N-terminal cleavage/methylation domain-containing protein